MNIFWEHGYEGTSLTVLQKAMGGITAPSFYAAFGSKEQLFREVVALYQEKIGGQVGAAMMEAPDTKSAIDALLRTAVEVFCARGTPKGCLVMLGATNCTTPSVQEHLHSLRERAPQLIKTRLERGVQAGDLPSGANTAALASFFSSLLYGTAMRARDGVSKKTLSLSVDAAMAAWDSLVSKDLPTKGE